MSGFLCITCCFYFYNLFFWKQYLPHVVPLAFNSCNLDDGSAVDIDDSDEDENVHGFGGVSSDDEAHDEPRVRNISIRTGVLDEKAAATQALGLFALHTKGSYAPYPFLNTYIKLILYDIDANGFLDSLMYFKLLGRVI